MTHRCSTPSRYNPTFVGAGWVCRKCGQRWIFFMPLQEFKVGEKHQRADWRPVSRWRWTTTYIDWSFVCAWLISLIIVGGTYLWLWHTGLL